MYRSEANGCVSNLVFLGGLMVFVVFAVVFLMPIVQQAADITSYIP